MTLWRDKAEAEFPDIYALLGKLSKEPDNDSWSCHVFLIELLRFTVAAHRAHDIAALQRCYGFAQWCLDQPGRFLADAARISFYEHVFDEWELRDEVVRWLPDSVKTTVRPLWEWRLSPEKLAEVDRLLATTNPAE